MFTLSKVIVIVCITAKPRFRLVRGENPLAEFTGAVNHRFQRGEEWIEETTYVDFVCFGAFANGVRELPKGTALYIEGRLRSDTWEDKETKKTRFKLLVVAERIRKVPGPTRAGTTAATTDQPVA